MRDIGGILPAGDVHVWLARPGTAHRTDAWLSILAASERARLRAFRQEADRELFLLSRIVLRTSLSLYEPVAPADWRFAAAANGRPHVAAPAGNGGLAFSISHTPGLVAIAIGRTGRLGVDVESLHSMSEVLYMAPTMMTKRELKELATHAESAQTYQLLRHWVLKEALSKACSLGLAMPFDRVGFDLGGQDPKLCMAPEELVGDHTRWNFTELNLGSGHVGALATEHGLRVSVREWPAPLTATVPVPV